MEVFSFQVELSSALYVLISILAENGGHLEKIIWPCLKVLFDLVEIALLFRHNCTHSEIKKSRSSLRRNEFEMQFFQRV